MKNKINSRLACPKCKGKLVFNNKIYCKKCKIEYGFYNNIPIFLDSHLSEEDEAIYSFRKNLKKYPKFFKVFKKTHSILGPPDTNYVRRYKINDTPIDYPLKCLNLKDKLILNIGSSSKKVYPNTINLDIGPFQNVDVVGDGKSLSFEDKSFDIILIECVLEHVDEAEKVISEAYRVLKPKGIIYISMPFIFMFHGSPNDYNRYTLEGLKRRLEIAGFKIKKTGILSGPSSTVSWILKYYLALLFSFNNDFLFSLFLNIFGWLTFPVKYLDIILNKYKKAHLMASVIYALGEK